MKVKDLIKNRFCYDKTEDNKILYYFVYKNKRKFTQLQLDRFGFPDSWLGKVTAFTIPVIEDKKVHYINRNHMYEDLVFLDLEDDVENI